METASLAINSRPAPRALHRPSAGLLAAMLTTAVTALPVILSVREITR